MSKPIRVTVGLAAIMLVALPSGALAKPTVGKVNQQLSKANAALAQAKDAKRGLLYGLATDELDAAADRTERARSTARKLSPKQRRKALRKVRRQEEKNAFFAARLANSAPALPAAPAEGAVSETLGLSLELVDDLLHGGVPGSLLGPGGTLNWTGLLPD